VRSWGLTGWCPRPAASSPDRAGLAGRRDRQRAGRRSGPNQRACV